MPFTGRPPISAGSFTGNIELSPIWTYKNQFYFYILIVNDVKRKLGRIIPFKIAPKRIHT